MYSMLIMLFAVRLCKSTFTGIAVLVRAYPLERQRLSVALIAMEYLLESP